MSRSSHEDDDVLSLAQSLLDGVRLSTDLSWDESKSCVKLVVSEICNVIKSSQLNDLRQVLLDDDKVLDVDNCCDAYRLKECFSFIREMHTDIQERSWALHEDPESVCASLKILNSLLKFSAPNVPLKLLTEPGSDAIHSSLVELYQMEQRQSVKIGLIEVIESVALLSPNLANHLLLNTNLVYELSRELMCKSSKSSDASVDDGEPMPYQLCQVLDAHYVNCLANHGELGLNALLAFNLQFKGMNWNTVLESFPVLSNSRELTQDLVNLANRKALPTWPYANVSVPRENSVLKLIRNLLSNSETRACFYHNDLLVLIDICLREITNLGPVKLRSEFLAIVAEMVKADLPQIVTRWSEVQATLYDLKRRQLDVEKDEGDAEISSEIRSDIDDLMERLADESL